MQRFTNLNTAQKMKFPLKDLVAFNEEILNEKINFSSSRIYPIFFIQADTQKLIYGKLFKEIDFIYS